MILTGAYLFGAVYVAAILYQSEAGFWRKALTLPLLLGIGVLFYANYLDRLGSPIAGMPAHDFLYVHHAVTDQGHTILLWADVPTVGNRLYAFPYTRQREKELQRAQKDMHDGVPQQGTVRRGASSSGDSDFGFSNGRQLMGNAFPKVHP